MSNFIPVSKPYVSQAEEDCVLAAVRSGWVSSLGPFIEKFESMFANFCGVEYSLATSSGTTGLHLALVALGIGPGDEVIVPDLTFIATANAVAYTGATPILADIDPETLCLSPYAFERAITPRTKAVIPVHLYGHPADMDVINAIATPRKIPVIEDAAEAHGAEYKGKPVGGLSNCGIFSFYGNKIITTGEGGILTTNDQHLYQRAKLLRDHAMSPQRRYWHEEIGFNYRMTNLQAALGVAQMQKIDDFIAHRRQLFLWYQESIRTSNAVRLNRLSPWAKSSYWMICLEVDWFDEETRADFMAGLLKQGIDTRPYFSAISAMPVYPSDDCPVARSKSRIGINLPTYFELTKNDVERIGSVVNELLATPEKR